MLWRVEEGVDRGRLGDFSGSDGGAVADLRHDRQVVGDEDERKVEVGRRATRGARGSAPAPSRRGRSSACRRGGSSARRRGPSRSPPAVSSRPRTRAGTGPRGLWGCRRARAAPPACRRAILPSATPVQLHRLLDLGADGLNRVEGVHRALEDHRDVAPTCGLTDSSPRARMFSPSSCTSPPPSHWRQEAHDREHRCRLPATRFADEPEALACLELEAHRTAFSSPPPGSSNQTFRSSTARSGVVIRRRASRAEADLEPANREMADAQTGVERVLERLAEEGRRARRA